MMIAIASLAVALVGFILYALDRKAKSEPIVWEHAGKISTVGGLVAAGIVFAIGTPIPEAVKEVAESVAPVAQEMFVGVPTF